MAHVCEHCGTDVEMVLTTSGLTFPIGLVPHPKGSFFLSADKRPTAIRVEHKARYLKRYIIHDDERWDSHIPRCVGMVESRD